MNTPQRAHAVVKGQRAREKLALFMVKNLTKLIRASNEPFGTQFQIITNKKLPKNNKSGHKGGLVGSQAK